MASSVQAIENVCMRGQDGLYAATFLGISAVGFDPSTNGVWAALSLSPR
jgi:hypothetical protein